MSGLLIGADMVIKNIVAEENEAAARKVYKGKPDEYEIGLHNGLVLAHAIVLNAPTVNAVELPCKIGDYVWVIRSYKGHKHPQRGVVGEMFFTDDMELMIVVKHIARGLWGEKVFATYEEAQAAIERRKTT